MGEVEIGLLCSLIQSGGGGTLDPQNGIYFIVNIS